MAHACNPCYLGGEDRKSESSLGKKIIAETLSQKQAGCGGTATQEVMVGRSQPQAEAQAPIQKTKQTHWHMVHVVEHVASKHEALSS
jgi:hypothetical protein